jgi:hypothetical protein
MLGTTMSRSSCFAISLQSSGARLAGPSPPPGPAVPGCAEQNAPSTTMVLVPHPAADASSLAPRAGAQEVDYRHRSTGGRPPIAPEVRDLIL